MKLSGLLRLLAVLSLVQGGSPLAAPSAHQDVESMYATYAEASKEQYAWQRLPYETDEQKAAREAERRRATEALVVAAGEFLQAFPDDPRHWEVLSGLIGANRTFTGTTAKADELAWQVFTRDAHRQILDSDGVPDAVWERAMTSEILKARQAVEAQHKQAGSADPAPWRAALDRLTARVPMARMLGPFEGHYAEFLLEQDEAAGDRFLQRLTTSSNPHVAQMAQGKLNARAAAQGPMELKFTAADGNEVDLAALRGQVVIIDFWATWCVPCLKEFPNTKAAYDAYKEHGVQMIGISFDHAPKDPAKPMKSDRTRVQFLTDAARLGMDWPQYYDGKGWDCELGRRYNIVSIPRIWVLDKSGVLQTQFAYGEKLWNLLAEHTGVTVPIPEEFRAMEGA